nr:MAG TPA: cistron-splicing factor [Caudoviricetes sp.]
MHPVLFLVFLCTLQGIQVIPPGHFSGAAP